MFSPPTISCPVAKLIKDEAIRKQTFLTSKDEESIMFAWFLLLLWHRLGTVDKDRKTRTWACMIVSKAQLLSEC